MAKIFHPLLAMIASGTDRELAKYVQFLKEEYKILRARIPGEIHTKLEERQRLLEFGKSLGRAIEELITIVSVSTFYRWCREENGVKKKTNPKGGAKPRWSLRNTPFLVVMLVRFEDFTHPMCCALKQFAKTRCFPSVQHRPSCRFAMISDNVVHGLLCCCEGPSAMRIRQHVDSCRPLFLGAAGVV